MLIVAHSFSLKVFSKGSKNVASLQVGVPIAGKLDGRVVDNCW